MVSGGILKLCTTHLFSHVGLKVLLLSDIDAHAPVFETLGGDLVIFVGHSGNDHIRDLQTLLQSQIQGCDNVVGVELVLRGDRM